MQDCSISIAEALEILQSCIKPSISCIEYLQQILPSLQILFARAEGLHAHGHTREACMLAQQLAKEMLTNPPDLSMEVVPVVTKGKTGSESGNFCGIHG